MNRYEMGQMPTKSSGIAKAGLVTGITSLGIIGANALSNNCGGCNNGGLLGNLFGGNNHCMVDQKEFAWAQAYNTAQAELAMEKSERYADNVGLNVYREIVSERKEIDKAQNDGFRFLFDEIRKNDKELALTQSDLKCLTVLNECQHNALEKGYTNAVELEAERRKCGDENIINYVNGTFVPGKLIMPLDSICPKAMPACEFDIMSILSKAVSKK